MALNSHQSLVLRLHMATFGYAYSYVIKLTLKWRDQVYPIYRTQTWKKSKVAD